MSNTAAAIIAIPIVISIALTAGVDPIAPAVAAAFGASDLGRAASLHSAERPRLRDRAIPVTRMGIAWYALVDPLDPFGRVEPAVAQLDEPSGFQGSSF